MKDEKEEKLTENLQKKSEKTEKPTENDTCRTQIYASYAQRTKVKEEQKKRGGRMGIRER